MKFSYTIEEEHHPNPLVIGGFLTIPCGIVPHVNLLVCRSTRHPLAARVSLINSSRSSFGSGLHKVTGIGVEGVLEDELLVDTKQKMMVINRSSRLRTDEVRVQNLFNFNGCESVLQPDENRALGPFSWRKSNVTHAIFSPSAL
jgi:hypothetical protein